MMIFDFLWKMLSQAIKKMQRGIKKIIFIQVYRSISKFNNGLTLKYIESDLLRYTGKSGGLSETTNCYLNNATFRWQVLFRIRQTDCKLGHFFTDFLERNNALANRIQIGYKTKIGYGLYIGHGGPIVVNPTAVIGNNCNLSQFTTIGSNDGKAAVIGDCVYIGPSVCIVEDVKIGNNVTIGAGSVVTKDIPDNATAAGNYARVLNFNNPGRYINNKFSI